MKKIFVCCVLICCRLLLAGQDVSLQNIIPPSPEGASLTKLGKYSVGPFTGRPDIGLPLYDIQTRNFTVPISFSYDGTGIRVDEIASWVGMNWSLNAGGMIARTVVGLVDDEPYGYYWEAPPRVAGITPSNTPDYVEYFKELLQVDETPDPTNQHDTDPDRFSYSFNGRSGSFIIKEDHSILQIPETSLKIEFTYVAYHNSKFTITDENGTKYLFNDIEFSNVYVGNELNTSSNLSTIISGWALTEIVSADGLEHMYFNYETETTGSRKSNNFTESYGHEFMSGGYVYSHRRYWSGMETTVLSKRLISILFTGGKLTFSRVGGRSDDLGSRLDEISVYSTLDNTNYTKLKSFQLQQGYYYSSENYTNSFSWSFTPVARDRYRLRFDALLLKDASGAEISRYQFSYNPLMPPPKTSCAQDWWGYYNGTANSTLVPPATIYAGFTIGGANRSANATYMKAGVLEKITYPTKGYTLFELEPHKYVSSYVKTGIVSNGGNVYGPEGTTHAQTVSFTTPLNGAFTIPGTIKIFIPPYSNVGLPAYSNPADQALQATNSPHVKIKNLTTNQETFYYSPNNAQYYSATLSYAFAPGTTYEISGSCYRNLSGALVSFAAEYSWPTTEFQTVTAGGLRVKSIKNYSYDNSLASQESYVYGTAQDGYGEYSGLEMYSNVTHKIATISSSLFGGATLEKYIFQSGFVFDQALIQGSPVAYRFVTKYYGDASRNTGKTTYHYGNEPLVTTFPVPSGMNLANNNLAILVTDDRWKKGNLKTLRDYKIKSDGTYEQVSGTSYTYTIQNTNAGYGLLSAVKTFRMMPDVYHIYDFAYAEYPITTGYIQVAQTVKEENLPDNVNKIVTTTNYTYDNTHYNFNTGISTTNSKGETVAVSKKYPFNKTALQATATMTTAESNAIDAMITRNMISPVVEEIKTVAGVQTERSRKQFEFVNANTIAPVNIKYQPGANPIEARLFFTKYDNLGNLVEQQKVNDAMVSYVYDYNNSHPIAEVTNAAENTIAYSSFEADGLGGWTMVPGSSILTAANLPTGNKWFSGTLNKNVPTGNYVVTLWCNIYGSALVNGAAASPIITQGEYALMEWKLTNVSSISVSAANIDEVRLYPEGAQMKTNTYSPLTGITSQCDENNRIIYYEYDSAGRLKLLRDQDRNIVRTFKYNYKQ